MKSIFPSSPQPCVSPILKWVGGKRLLAPTLRALMPSEKSIHNYVEPFVGGGGMFFSLQPHKAIINDYNEELMNVYKVIKEAPLELLECLNSHDNTREHYYKVRDMDRHPQFDSLSAIERAARIIYLNKTCFNGLFRVNSQGFFNVPYGYYKNPQYREVSKITSVSRYLNIADVKIMHGDYSQTLDSISKGTFVYLDPPYVPVSQTSNFTGYNAGGFSEKEQVRLRDFCCVIAEKGARFMLSNSNSPLIFELYKDFKICEVKANRTIAASAESRGMVKEVVVLNY